MDFIVAELACWLPGSSARMIEGNDVLIPQLQETAAAVHALLP